MGVSIDGYDDTYARVRGVDSFRQVMATYLGLRELTGHYPRLRPHVAYTMSRFNAGKFSLFRRRYVNREYGIGINDISFTFEHLVGFYYQSFAKSLDGDRARFNQLLMDDVATILELRKVRNLAARFDRKDRFYGFYLSHIQDYLNKPAHQVIPCTAAKLSAFIDPYGNVQPCSMWNDIIGNLKKQSFEEIWASEKLRETRKAVVEERCPNCWTPCEAQPSWVGNLPKVLVR